MQGINFKSKRNRKEPIERKRLKMRLRHWQQARSWARLIREAEDLWQVDSKELKRLGALELGQLLHEVPYSYRRRVNLWLIKYCVATRLVG